MRILTGHPATPRIAAISPRRRARFLGASMLAGTGLLAACLTPAWSQDAKSTIQFVKASAPAPAARPASLPETDEVVVPTLSPERVSALAKKQKFFPIRDSGLNLLEHNQKAGANEKIVGGTKAADGAYPFQAALIKVKREKDGSIRPVAQFCGGALLTSRWVLTAAHCFVHGDKGKIAQVEDARDIGVHLGATNLVSRAERILAKRIAVHPKYVPGTSVNDIALVELERPPVDSPKIDTVTVVTKETEAETLPLNSELTIVGWGMTEAKRSSMDLLESKVNVVDHKACNRALTLARVQGEDLTQAVSDITFTFNMSQVARKSLEQSFVQLGGTVTPQMFCAAASVDGRDTCPGDSGGPILRKYPDGRMVQVGIVSFGVGECGVAALPGVYTRLSLYTDWMRQVVATTTPVTQSTPTGTDKRAK